MSGWGDIARTEQHPAERDMSTVWHEPLNPDWWVPPHFKRQIMTIRPVPRDTTIRIKYSDYFGDHVETPVEITAGKSCIIEIEHPSGSQSVGEEILESEVQITDPLTGDFLTSHIVHIYVHIPLGIIAVLQARNIQAVNAVDR